MKQLHINDMDTLLDWIEQQLLRSEPRVPTSSACVALFTKFMGDLRGDGCSWSVAPKNIVEIILANTSTTHAPAKLISVLLKCMDEVEHDSRVDHEICFASLPCFISVVSDELKLALAIKEADDDEVFTVTGRLRNAKHLVCINVHYTPWWAA